MSLRVCSRVSLCIAALGLTQGCGLVNLVPGLENFGAQSAENPLKGQPLAWQEKSREVPFEGQKACTTWPIENQLKVKATEADVCLDGELYRVVDAQFPGPSDESIHVTSDGPGESNLGNQTEAFEGRVRKVGSCTDKNTGIKSVWSISYSGCKPNKTMTGQPLVTMKSTYLKAGPAHWKFPAPTPQATPASAGSGATGTTTTSSAAK